jgi:hypothetical protein
MQLKGLRLSMIALITLLSLGLLMGGSIVYNKYTSDQPLFKALNGIQEVKNIQLLKNDKKGMTVLAELNEVEDLSSAYRKIAEAVAPVAGSKPYRILLTDNRSTELESVYYRIHYTLQEGIATGNFSVMANDLESRLAEMGFHHYRVYVAQDYVFLQIHQDGKYLYDILPRSADGQVAVVQLNEVGSEQI